MKKRNIFLFATACAALLVALLWWSKRFFLPADAYSGLGPAFWIAEPLLLTVFFFALTAACRKNFIIYLCIGLGSICLFFTAAEAYFRLTNLEPRNVSEQSAHLRSGEATIPEPCMYDRHPLIGGVLKKQAVRAAHRQALGPREEPLFDVVYSINAEGRRITPEQGKDADNVVLLFGCSFTFGFGVNDQDTYAWKLAELLGKKYQVVNLGVSGYGAHQMLALLQSGQLDHLLERYKHRYAFFLTIADHLNRCTGRSPWIKNGPRYVLEQGKPVYAGDFSETFSFLRFFDTIFLHSAFYPKLRSLFSQLASSGQDAALHTAILAQCAQELQARGTEFAILVWPDAARLIPPLRARSLQVLPLSPRIPDWSPDNYKQYRADGFHPNALGHAIIAEEAFKHIEKQKARMQTSVFPKE